MKRADVERFNFSNQPQTACFMTACQAQYGLIMTTDSFINENKTATFKKGDKVVMHTCYEASLPKYNGKIWECQTDSYKDRGGQDVVFLRGFSGCFAAEFLQKVQMQYCA